MPEHKPENQAQGMTRDDAENIAWLMVVITCVIALAAVLVSWSRHNVYGIAGCYVLAGFTGGYAWWLNREVKHRNTF